MASIWKKIIEKVNSLPKDEAHAADWEAMHAKIVAHPDLNVPNRRLRYLPILLIGLALLTLTGVGIGYMWSNSAEKVERAVKPVQSELPLSARTSTVELPEEANASNANISQKERITPKPVPNSKNTIANKPALVKSKPEEFVNEEAGLDEDALERTLLKAKSQVTSLTAGSPTMENATEHFAQSVQEQLGLDHEQQPETAKEAEAVGPLEAEAENEEPSIVPKTEEEVSSTEKKMSRDLSEPDNHTTDSKTMEAETEEELPSKTDTALSIPSKEEIPEQAPATNAPSFTELGFKLNAINANGLVLTNFQSGFIGYGGGFDVDWSSGKWLINTGLYAYQLEYDPFQTGAIDPSGLDTSYTSVWVVLGPNRGEYVDVITGVDTAAVNLRQQISYVEMPILLGRRFEFNRYTFDIYAGTLLNQLVQSGSGETAARQSMGVDLLFQPSIAYQLSESWSLKARVGLRYSLLNQDFRAQQFSNNFQIGVSYHR